MSIARDIGDRVKPVLILGQNSVPFAISVEDTDGSALDLTGATATFKLVDAETLAAVINEGACTISGSVVTYQPATGEITDAGDYFGRFTITLSDASVLKFGHYLYEFAEDI